MAEFDLERQLDRGEDCPSESILDRHHWGELPSGQAAAVDEHVNGCRTCRQRMDLRKKGFDAFDEVDPGMLRARIVQASQPQPRSANGGFSLARWFGWRTTLGIAASLVIILVVALGVWPDAINDPDRFQAKGSTHLRVYRERDGTVQESLSGDRFQPGDRLRFKVDLPASGHLMVVGVEQSGKMYPGFPADGSTVSKPAAAGRDLELAGAIRLDDSLGEEWIHLVLCPRAFSLEELGVGESGKIMVPNGCRFRSFAMRKDGP